jgi:hypothetical protein
MTAVLHTWGSAMAASNGACSMPITPNMASSLSWCSTARAISSAPLSARPDSQAARRFVAAVDDLAPMLTTEIDYFALKDHRIGRRRFRIRSRMGGNPLGSSINAAETGEYLDDVSLDLTKI